MITVPWWVMLLTGGIGPVLAFAAATWWRAQLDQLVLDRVEVVLSAALAGFAEDRAEPVLPIPVDPWASYERLWEGLDEPKAPQLPEHPWLRDPTGPLDIRLPLSPQASKIVEAVVDDTQPKARDRFEGEPKAAAAKDIVVAAVVAGAEVRPEAVEVAA